MELKKITIVGGDKRNIELARLLCKQGHEVKLFGFVNYEKEMPMQCKNLHEAVAGADYIIGPIPASHNCDTLNAPFHNASVYVESLFRIIKPHQIFLAGLIKPDLLALANKYSIHLIDMLAREELLINNAIPTAEGAIKIAIEETDITIHNNQMMVLGYGRIGKILSNMLRGIGGKVMTVVNSNEAAAFAASNSHTAIYVADMIENLPCADVIFNTVPEILLDKDNMQYIRKDTLIIDLASPPYGVDVNDSRDFGLKVLYTNSLPGKIAPVTTASYILGTINRIWGELEVQNDTQ